MTIQRSVLAMVRSLTARTPTVASPHGAKAAAVVALLLTSGATVTAMAQERLPWGQAERARVIQPGEQDDVATNAGDNRAPGYGERYSQRDTSGGYPPARDSDRERDEAPPSRDYRRAEPVYPSSPDRDAGRTYDDRPRGDRSYGDRAPSEGSYGGRAYGDRPDAGRPYDGDRSPDSGRYGGIGPGQPYEPASPPYAGERDPDRAAGYPRRDQTEARTYSAGEIHDAGHRFFGSITSGLASVIEHAFKRQGRPNGYILGEEGGGAFIAGLRYGEGTLHMKDGTRQKVYWQGPSIGYDFGAEGSKSMILVYDLDHPGMIYQTFGGVSGSAYLVGGVGVTFMKSDDVVLAPIRAGVGLRLGANLGYLKYSRAPTWNPF